MPESAIANAGVDYVLPISELSTKLADLVSDGRPRHAEAEAVPPSKLGGSDPSGMRTDITCPQCGGVLWEEIEGRVTTYQCRAGHMYSPDSLLEVQGEDLDSAIWRPIRMLQERGALLRRLAARARGQGRLRSARYFDREAQEVLWRAAEMRRALGKPELGEDPSDLGQPGRIGAEQQ
jgi:two-component system chemotaxis response regulator CheB